MSHKVSFVGDGAKITLEVFDYENLRAQNPDDASWLRAELTCAIGSFSGVWKTAFTTHDLAALHDRIEPVLKSLSGRASFQNTEGDLTLNVEFSKSGKVQIDGVAEPPATVKAALHFSFASDDIRYIQQILGHEDIKTTQIYTHVAIRALQQVYAAKIGDRRDVPQFCW